jgi:Phage tail sheath C-terminal domain/Phage tail sheath protein subtilisin-like domain
MSESIAEMVIPGTYIEVRAEGLISVGAIATGNIGVVGTAARGPRNEVVALGSAGEVLDLYGATDPFGDPVGAEALTLTRTLQLAFAGGARNVFAVRVANGDPATATAQVQTTSGANGFGLSAADAGSYGNAITVSLVNEGTDAAPSWKLTLIEGRLKEEHFGTTVGELHASLASSAIATAGDVSNAGSQPRTIDPPASFAGGNDRADVSSADVAEGLAVLENEPVNILIVAGLGSETVRGIVLAHLERTEGEAHERIAILGAEESGSATNASAVLDEADALEDDRVVLVAPGIRAVDPATDKQITLPPPYLAAVVAGRLATVAPHVSLTNKTVPIDNLDVNYSSPTLQRLLQAGVLLVRKKFGFQVVRAITTETAAFRQITVRRIVDFAKAGVRSGADPYIGRLNNARVRAALRATLDGFLSQMVLDEMLVGYELDVTATRAQEIRGIAVVTMTLQPTFSIDFIRVTMNLQ